MIPRNSAMAWETLRALLTNGAVHTVGFTRKDGDVIKVTCLSKHAAKPETFELPKSSDECAAAFEAKIANYVSRLSTIKAPYG